jgi:hypothetical protein
MSTNCWLGSARDPDQLYHSRPFIAHPVSTTNQITMEEKKLTEQESLRLITEMIHKAKSSFHESGTSAILWGSVVAIAGFTSFAERFWNFSIGFDIWLLVLAAFIPQLIISIKESKHKKWFLSRPPWMRSGLFTASASLCSLSISM